MAAQRSRQTQLRRRRRRRCCDNNSTVVIMDEGGRVESLLLLFRRRLKRDAAARLRPVLAGRQLVVGQAAARPVFGALLNLRGGLEQRTRLAAWGGGLLACCR